MPRPAPRSSIARLYKVRGKVQGVGFRFFVKRAAAGLELTGYVRNLDDGAVEVIAVGTAAGISALAGMLRKGPAFADVRGVEEREVPVQQYGSFEIEP